MGRFITKVRAADFIQKKSFISLILLSLAHIFHAELSRASTPPNANTATEISTKCDSSTVNTVLFEIATQIAYEGKSQLHEQAKSCDPYSIIESLAKDLHITTEENTRNSPESVMAAYTLGEIGKCAVSIDYASQLCELWGSTLMKEKNINAIAFALEETSSSAYLPLQEATLSALGKIGNYATIALPKVVMALATVDDNGKPAAGVRNYATYVISNIQSANNNRLFYDPILQAFLAEGDEDLKIRAAQTIGHFEAMAHNTSVNKSGARSSSNLLLLIQNLTDTNESVREAMAQAIRQSGIREIREVEALENLFLDNRLPDLTRELSFELLSKIDLESAEVSSIVRRLIDERSQYPDAAILALWIAAENDVRETEITTTELVSLLRSDKEDMIRFPAFYFIGKTGYVNEELMKVINDVVLDDGQATSTRAAAVYALSRAGTNGSTTAENLSLNTIQNLFEDIDCIKDDKACEIIIRSQAIRAASLFTEPDNTFIVSLLSFILEPTDCSGYGDTTNICLDFPILAAQSLQEIIAATANSNSLSSRDVIVSSLNTTLERLNLSEDNVPQTVRNLQLGLILSEILDTLIPSDTGIPSERTIKIRTRLYAIDDPRVPGSDAAGRQAQRRGFREILRDWLRKT